jgi:hypothetical protein
MCCSHITYVYASVSPGLEKNDILLYFTLLTSQYVTCLYISFSFDTSPYKISYVRYVPIP